MEGRGRDGLALALFEDVGDIFAAEGFELQRIVEFSGDGDDDYAGDVERSDVDVFPRVTGAGTNDGTGDSEEGIRDCGEHADDGWDVSDGAGG